MIRKIGIVGGGPAGLYLALLVKRRRPDIEVRVLERSPADATWGFGVVLADGGLRQLAEADPDSFAQIQAELHPIPHQIFRVRGEDVPIDKARSGGAIGRLALLQILQRTCLDLGVKLQFRTDVADLDVFDDCDVVVGADGSKSLVRERFSDAFGTRTRFLTNRFAWFGVDRAFDASHLNFKQLPGGGALCGHYYAYARDKSTFVMECDAPTWDLHGLDRLTDTERRLKTQAFFADELGGFELIENNSIWRRFPVVTNERWHHGRYVLLGDALRTAHFSIGSGTRMALEDAIALAAALTGASIAQGISGLMQVTGEKGRGPMRAGIPIADLSAGLFCANGILTALLEREASGRGQWVQTSLLQAQIYMMDFQAMRWLMNGEVPGQSGNDHPTSSPTGVFETRDGYMNIAAMGNALFARLCESIGAAELIGDPRFGTVPDRATNRPALNAAINTRTRSRDTQDWIAVLNEAGVPCGPILTLDQTFADPQVRHLRAVWDVEHPQFGAISVLGQPYKLSRTAPVPPTPAPARGQHSREVLSEFGFSTAEIAELADAAII